MYCLQWLLPFLLIPKHLVHPAFLIDQAHFFWLYIIGFFLERRPCHSCTLIFLAAVCFICYSDSDRCIFWPVCETVLNGQMCKQSYEARQALESKPMFLLAEFKHTVKIEADEADIDFEACVISKINGKYANKVVIDVGLCLSFYDFVKIYPSYIPQGGATIYVPVHFRYFVFELLPGEIVDCTIQSVSSEGLRLTTGFFSDIYVPRHGLPTNSVFDDGTQSWTWQVAQESGDGGETILNFPMEVGDTVRVFTDSVTYHDSLETGKNGPMMVTALMGTPGLGCLTWWHGDEEGPPVSNADDYDA